MMEDEVKKRTRRWLETKGYKVKAEVKISCPDDSENNHGSVVLDFWAYKDPAKIVWCECKGDQSLSELLEGFIRLEFGVFYGGGHGILAVPHTATMRLLSHKKFLAQAKDVIQILDVEQNKLKQM
ncbi:unnamed protein product [marine sediment metagenome]|uniref:Restriction endonuclease type IV Mrr domain-containing protein n=1 Tax=marine sediment metagenome TaxID=412755 RepID=X1M716_9ZZZZ